MMIDFYRKIGSARIRKDGVMKSATDPVVTDFKMFMLHIVEER